MTLDDVHAIDGIGIDRQSGEVVLTIIDHWDWNDPERHLLTLQKKINVYLDFIESGEMSDAYPQGKGHSRCIEIVGRIQLPDIAAQYIRDANIAIASLAIPIRWSHQETKLASKPDVEPNVEHDHQASRRRVLAILFFSIGLPAVVGLFRLEMSRQAEEAKRQLHFQEINKRMESDIQSGRAGEATRRLYGLPPTVKKSSAEQAGHPAEEK